MLAHTGFENEILRFNKAVQELVAKQSLSGKRCQAAMQELATRKQYHGKLVQALWKGMWLPGSAPPVQSAIVLPDFLCPKLVWPEST